MWRALALIFLGVSTAALGDPQEGLVLSDRGIDAYQVLTTPPVFWPLLTSVRARGLALAAAGRLDEAEAQYRKVWQNGREGKYRNMHYELAAWGLGELLRSKKDLAGAAIAYELVNQAPNPDPDILQKANLAAGEMYDLLQKRDLAMKAYEAVLTGRADSGQADQARRYIREAYRE